VAILPVIADLWVRWRACGGTLPRGPCSPASDRFRSAFAARPLHRASIPRVRCASVRGARWHYGWVLPSRVRFCNKPALPDAL